METKSVPTPITVNALIAYNLRRARGQLTQEQAAQRLEEHLGVRWAKQTFSAAERSLDERGRRRAFDVGEPFARAFHTDIAYFLTPPPNGPYAIYCGEPGEAWHPLSPGELLALIEPPESDVDIPAGLERYAARLRRRETAARYLPTTDEEV